MPHTNHSSHTTTNNTTTSSSGDDLGSTDEVKVFKDEGDREDEKISSENLLEEKSSLIDLTESEVSTKRSVMLQEKIMILLTEPNPTKRKFHSFN